MADPHPLQRGDVAPDVSDYNFSTEADRRSQDVASAKKIGSNYHGEYPSADQSRAEGGRLWKVGQADRTPFLSAPYPVISMDGDNTGYPAEIHEIDIDAYGDAYDPTAPMRVRTVAPAENHWELDSDHDGHRN